METDLVTVLVPAMNEEQFIGPCLDSILSQDHPNMQVLVVDGGSSDGTIGIVQRYAARDPRVTCLSSPGKTIPSSLNIGLQAAEGKWLVRVDAHSTIPSGYIRRLVEHLRTGQWGGVGGRKDGVVTSSKGGAIAAALSSRFGVGNSTYHYGTSVQIVDHVPFGAYPTSLLREIGGWDERLHANEDFELDYRLRRQGQRLLFDPGVVIAWRNRETLGELFRQYRRYGRGKARVAMLHPRSLKARHLATPALVGSWVLAAALAFRWPWFLLVVVPYAVALLLASVLTSPNAQGQASWLDVAAAFLAMHVAWGIGFWEGVLGEIVRRLRASASRRVTSSSAP
jgi:cellulose synthase/poly-beta-1,6-N-acetylglucosamine synthase-like glycosyltransferase